MRSTLFVIFLGILSFLQASARANHTVSDTNSKVDSLLWKYDEQINTYPHQALKYAHQALKKSQSIKDEKGQLISNYNLGKAYYLTTNMDSARIHLQKGIDLATAAQDTFHLALCKKWIGSVWRHQSNLTAALQAYEQSLALAEAVQMKDEIPKITQNIAGLFCDLEQYEQAIIYFKESFENMQNPSDKVVCNTNLGLAYLRNQQFEQALQTFKASLELCQATKDEDCEISPLKMIANTYMQMNQYDKALTYGMEALERRKVNGNKELLINAYNQVGLIQLNLENYDLALQNFQKCMELVDFMSPAGLPLIHANIALAYEGLGSYEKAVDHLWKFQDLKDSIYSQQNQMQTQELLAKFDTERKEKEILLLQKEKELQESELNRQTLIRNLAIVGIVLAILILIVIRKMYMQKIETQQIIANKQQEINAQKTKELIRENELKATKANIEGQEQERKRIAQELHDGIAGNLATMKLHLIDLDSQADPEQMKHIINQMDITYEQVRSLSHHLMPPSTQNTTLIQLIKSFVDEIKPRITFTIGFNYHPKEVIDQLNANTKHELFRVTQELMNNILKHANPTHVDIQLNVNNDELNLMVEDNGTGFDLANTTSGIGLKSIDSRVKKIKGQCHIDSKPNHGTTISIDIPLLTESIYES